MLAVCLLLIALGIVWTASLSVQQAIFMTRAYYYDGSSTPSPADVQNERTPDAIGPSSRGTIMMGPASAEQRAATFVHEYIHVLHYTAVPETFLFRNTAGTEGFATYIEVVTGLQEDPLQSPEVRELIAAEGIEAILTENLRGAEAWIAYSAAASYYQFFAEQGGGPIARARTQRPSLGARCHASRTQSSPSPLGCEHHVAGRDADANVVG